MIYSDYLDITYRKKIYEASVEVHENKTTGKKKRNCQKCGKEIVMDTHSFTLDRLIEIRYVGGEEIYDQALIDKLIKSKIFKKRIEKAAAIELNKWIDERYPEIKDDLLCPTCYVNYEKALDVILNEENRKITFELSAYR